MATRKRKITTMTHKVHLDVGKYEHEPLCGVGSHYYSTNNVKNVTCKRCRQMMKQ